MENKNIATWDDIPYDIRQLVEVGIFTKEEAIEIMNRPLCETTYDESESYPNKPVYATKSNMTKKEAEFLFVHQGNMNEWRLEMLLENGYELEANDEWNEFIEDLLNQREITKRQYNNWKDRFR